MFYLPKVVLFYLPKVVQTTSSAWPQGFGAYSPLRAPLMVAYRLQMDTGTVAVLVCTQT